MGVEKYLASVTLDRTYEHSTTLDSPMMARQREKAKRAPAKAIDRVAEPAPALALTTSVPASCKRGRNGQQSLPKWTSTGGQYRVLHLYPLSQGLELVLGEVDRGLALGDEGDDGDSGVSTDDGNIDLGGVQALGLTNEGVGADNVQGGDTEDPVGVVDTSLLEYLRGDGNSAVHLKKENKNSNFLFQIFTARKKIYSS